MSISESNEKGVLCGRGDMSIRSTAGEEEGRGGVVMFSIPDVSVGLLFLKDSTQQRGSYHGHFRVPVDWPQTATFGGSRPGGC